MKTENHKRSLQGILKNRLRDWINLNEKSVSLAEFTFRQLMLKKKGVNVFDKIYLWLWLSINACFVCVWLNLNLNVFFRFLSQTENSNFPLPKKPKQLFRSLTKHEKCFHCGFQTSKILNPSLWPEVFRKINKILILIFFFALYRAKIPKWTKTFQNKVKFIVTKKSKFISRTMFKLNTFCWLEILFFLSFVWHFFPHFSWVMSKYYNFLWLYETNLKYSI